MKKKEQIDIKSLIPLEKYLEVLVDAYPDPVRASDLAKKTGHSKAAISKIRKRLLQICDPKPMLFEKGFVLTQNVNNMPLLFFVFLANGRHKRFLSSRFVKLLVNGKAIHERASLLFPGYGQRFTEEDTAFIIHKLIDTLSKLPADDFRFLYQLITTKKPESILTLKTANDIQTALIKLEPTFDNEAELIKAAQLRDKAFFLIRDILWALIENLDILKRVQNEKQEIYRFVYKDTIDFYLKKVFNKFDESLLKSGKQFLGKDAEKRIRLGASQIMS